MGKQKAFNYIEWNRAHEQTLRYLHLEKDTVQDSAGSASLVQLLVQRMQGMILTANQKPNSEDCLLL